MKYSKLDYDFGVFKSFFAEYVDQTARFRIADFFNRLSAGFCSRFLAFLPKNSLKKVSFSLLRFFWTSKRNEGQVKPKFH
ncbi:hypothetical protein AO058_12615 [Salegentibacter sp. T436]|nr:hypothetical protein AO058_12615 [Salegentibacter sp. T436]